MITSIRKADSDYQKDGQTVEVFLLIGDSQGRKIGITNMCFHLKHIQVCLCERRSKILSIN